MRLPAGPALGLNLVIWAFCLKKPLCVSNVKFFRSALLPMFRDLEWLEEKACPEKGSPPVFRTPDSMARRVAPAASRTPIIQYNII